MKIDSHHHFWKYDPVDYDWIDDSMNVIRRDFLPPHLLEEIQNVGIDGVVSVQARQTLEETVWLLEMARTHDFIKGVVGWVPLVSPTVKDDLAGFAEHTKLCSVRHVLQGEADDRYMLREDFNEGIRALRDFDLVYDILILERHLPQTIEFVDRHPGQMFVLDHIAKPRIREGAFEPWRTHITELAKRPNIYCKASGMVTEADFTHWQESGLKPYFDTVLEAFTPSRLMFGSDWPVCEVACTYTRWHGLVSKWTARLSVAEQDQIFGRTAADVYKLSEKTNDMSFHLE